MQASMSLTPTLLTLSICHIPFLESNSPNEVHTESDAYQSSLTAQRQSMLITTMLCGQKDMLCLGKLHVRTCPERLS